MDSKGLCILLVLMFVNGLLSFTLHHKRQMDTIDESGGMMGDVDSMAKAEENLDTKYFEGDILTTPNQMKGIDRLLFHSHDTSKSVHNPSARGLVKNVRRLWPNGVVYYRFSSNSDQQLPSERKELIMTAIQHWKDRTCLKFQERNNEKDYVQFQKGFGCSSFVGRIGGGQRLVVGPGCALGNVIHEIGHAIGFFHEMSRPDRDDYVEIHKENVKTGYEGNFNKFSPAIIDSRNVPYDYGSIMHYSRIHFSRGGGKETVVPIKKSTAQIGQRLALSPLDVEQAKLLYNCAAASNKEDGESEINVMPDNDMTDNMETMS